MEYVLVVVTVLVSGDVEVSGDRFHRLIPCEDARKQLVQIQANPDVTGIYSMSGQCVSIRTPPAAAEPTYNKPVF